MAYYTYDEEADALYILLVPEDDVVIERTEEITPTIHVDLDEKGRLVGVEVLSPDGDMDLSAIRDRFGVDVKGPVQLRGLRLAQLRPRSLRPAALG